MTTSITPSNLDAIRALLAEDISKMRYALLFHTQALHAHCDMPDLEARDRGVSVEVAKAQLLQEADAEVAVLLAAQRDFLARTSILMHVPCGMTLAELISQADAQVDEACPNVSHLTVEDLVAAAERQEPAIKGEDL